MSSDERDLLDVQLRLGGATVCQVCVGARPSRCCACGYLCDDLVTSTDPVEVIQGTSKGEHTFCPSCAHKMVQDAYSS